VLYSLLEYIVHFRTADKFARGICMQSAIFIRRIKFWPKTLGLRQHFSFFLSFLVVDFYFVLTLLRDQ
jgi:hypothetical protein